MAYFLGLDAGGTKTECVLAQEDEILARVISGTMKIMRASTDEASRHLDDLLHAVSTQAGIPLHSIDCTCVGLAGIGVPQFADWIRQAFLTRVSGKIILSGDEVIALDAAFFGGPGVLVMAGTGSNIIARSTEGQILHEGGWGPVLADEGSGHWIGKQAVRAILEAADRNETTLLCGNVLDAWKLPNLARLIDRANQLPEPDFSELAPAVAQSAEQGDRYAQRVLQRAGEELGLCAVLALRRLQAVERVNHGFPEVAFTGSILCHISLVLETMRATILRELPETRIQQETIDPMQGALWQARSHYKAMHSPASAFPNL